MGKHSDSVRGWTTGRLLAGLTISVLVVGLAESRADAAAISVVLNFDSQGAGSFLSQIDSAATAAGLPANYFPAADVPAIELAIQQEIGRVYAPFNVSFSTLPDATARVMTFADNTTQSVYGLAPYNWRNAFLPNTTSPANAAAIMGQIFPQMFDPSLLNNGVVTVAQNETRIEVAIGDTAAHELGHTFGLDHQDAYGVPGITPANYANTGGLQNTSIMASGATGLSDDRSTPRNFNPLELDKLAQSVNMLSGYNPNLIPDASDTHTSLSTAGPNAAQPITFKTEPLTGDGVVTITSGAAGSGVDDVYSFTAPAGAPLTADIISLSQPIENDVLPKGTFFNTPINAVLTLWRDNGGNPVEVASSINKQYNGNNWLSGTQADGDPMILNQPLPATDTYYLEVNNAGGAAGNYEMFVSVPEPLSVLFLVFGSCTLLLRRKARRG